MNPDTSGAWTAEITVAPGPGPVAWAHFTDHYVMSLWQVEGETLIRALTAPGTGSVVTASRNAGGVDDADIRVQVTSADPLDDSALDSVIETLGQALGLADDVVCDLPKLHRRARNTTPLRLFSLFLLLLVAGCVIETIPDTPGNAAIHLLTAFQTGDADQVEFLTCDDAIGGAGVNLDDPATLGALTEMYETARHLGGFGGDSEYSILEELDLQVATAWTEVVFENEDTFEVWRLHMVRENGKWKTCDAELRT